jgi:hypothetical protein
VLLCAADVAGSLLARSWVVMRERRRRRIHERDENWEQITGGYDQSKPGRALSFFSGDLVRIIFSQTSPAVHIMKVGSTLYILSKTHELNNKKSIFSKRGGRQKELFWGGERVVGLPLLFSLN